MKWPKPNQIDPRTKIFYTGTSAQLLDVLLGSPVLDV